MRVSGTYSLASPAYSSSMKSPLFSPCAISRVPRNLPTPCVDVHHEIARLQVRHVGLKRRHLRLAGTGPRDQFGGVEQILAMPKIASVILRQDTPRAARRPFTR